MKLYAYYFIVLIVLIFLSCGETGKTNSPDTVSPAKEVQQDTAKLRLLRIIEGGWVCAPYVTDLLSSRSPFHADKYAGFQTELMIDISRMQGDTLFNPGSMLNYNENHQFWILLETGADKKIQARIYEGQNWNNHSFYIDYKIANRDTVLAICDRNEDTGQAVSEENYIRIFRTLVVPENDMPPTALEYLVNRTLFSGRYQLCDKKGNVLPGEVVFDNLGNMSGIESFKKYRVNVDFDGSAYPQFDFVNMVDLTDGFNSFAFTRKEDRIELYEMNNSVIPPRKGRLIYILKKIS